MLFKCSSFLGTCYHIINYYSTSVLERLVQWRLPHNWSATKRKGGGKLYVSYNGTLMKSMHWKSNILTKRDTTRTLLSSLRRMLNEEYSVGKWVNLLYLSPKVKPLHELWSITTAALQNPVICWRKSTRHLFDKPGYWESEKNCCLFPRGLIVDSQMVRWFFYDCRFCFRKIKITLRKQIKSKKMNWEDKHLGHFWR